MADEERNLEKCFEKHPFEELNDLDVYSIAAALQYVFKRLSISKETLPQVAFLDVGCNAGSFVKVLQKMGVTTNIHCFEPHPVLSKKTKSVYPHITMNQCCLSNNTDDIVLNIPTWSVGLSSMIDRPVFSRLSSEGQVINRVTVQSRMVDEYLETNNIKYVYFMKIDVEGGEKMVLEGAKKSLQQKRILSGMFEVGETLKDANTSEREICEILEGCGYKVNKTQLRNDYVFHI